MKHVLLAFFAVALSPALADEIDDDVVLLDAFITSESALVNPGDVLPTSRPFLSVFGEQAIADVPRSVTILTPELMDQLGVQDFADLGRIGAGTQQINYYGLPGIPTLRGTKGAVFFNGMQRAYQRNEMPLSFGSLEAMDIVKGPAPAQFGPAVPGGYVNLIPKSPFFDRRRGSLRLEAGSYDTWRAQADVGGPFLLGRMPAAYRVSVTGQLAGSYYDRVRNDFVSLYGAIKVRVAKDVSVFAGGEFFRYKSNENPGWNRTTQRLIDTGEYVIGEPVGIVSGAWGGVADRSLLAANPALVVPAAVVDDGVARGFITAAQREAMRDLSDAAERAQAYAGIPAAQLAALEPTTSGFQYTPDYFAAGGRVFTRKIDGSNVLSDERDHADSENLLVFGDLTDARQAGVLRRLQFQADHIETEKLSSYGYAFNTRQTVAELKASQRQEFAFLEGMELTFGGSARFTDAKILQDYAVEPFSRRDISLPAVSPNTVVVTGPQRGPDGKNFWTATAQGGANAHSRLWQLSAFAQATNRLTPRLTTYTALLAAHAPYTTSYPPEVDLVPLDDPRRAPGRGHRNYTSASFNPVFAVARGVNLYGALQYGTSLDPLQGGAIVGAGNFARHTLLEAGVKTGSADGQFHASLATFQWRETRYDDRTSNAEPLKGHGAELEVAWAPREELSFVGSFDVQRVRRLSDLGFHAWPLTEEQIALYGGVLNTQFGPAVFDPAGGARPVANPELVYPGSPERQAKLFAVYSHASGFGASGGPVWSAAYWHNFDHTLRVPSSLVWNVSVFFRSPKLDVALAVENLTDEDWFLGGEPLFAANTLITKAPGRSFRLTVTRRF